MKMFPVADLARHTGNLFTAATLAPVVITKYRKPRFVIMTFERYQQLSDKHSSQFAVSVANMPEAVGALLDKGIEDFLHGL